MGMVHCYIAVENLALTAGQKTTFWNAIAALGDNDHPNPSRRNHSVTSGAKTIFEAEFTDDEISAANLKTLLATALSVEAATITTAARETNQGIRLTYTYDSEAKVQVDIFGYPATGAGRPTKLESNTQALAYMAATWGGGTLVSGVPAVDPDWSTDVASWWEVHPLNPDAPYPLDISHPSTVIDVEVDYEGDLQAAIDAVDENGAQLILGAVYYNGEYAVIDKRHLHLIGQAGTRIKTIRFYPNDTFGADYGDWANAIQTAGNPNHAAAMAIIADLPCDFYFSDITFDGNNEPFYENPEIAGDLIGVGVAGFAVRDMVFDRCTFEKYSKMDPPRHHGAVNLGGYIANVWFRDCVYSPPGLVAIYLDGVHGGGHVNCNLTGKFSSYGLLFLTNNDFTYDYDGDDQLGDSEMRNSAYVVVYGCTYTTTGGLALLVMSGAHVLAKDNTVIGNMSRGFQFAAVAGTDTRRAYQFDDFQIRDNDIQGSLSYLVWQAAWAGLASVPPRIAGTIGGAVLAGNHVNALTDWIYTDGGVASPANTIGAGNTTG